MAKSRFMRQLKKGNVPNQPVNISTRLNDPIPSKPSTETTKKRSGLSVGSQMEARPGMTGKNDFPRNRKQ